MVLSFDPLFLAILVARLVVSSEAQPYIRSTFSKWGHVQDSGPLSGMQVGDVSLARR